MSKRTKLQFYTDMTLTSKNDVLESLNDYINGSNDSVDQEKDAIISAAKRRVIKRFYSIVEKHNLPDVNKWWFYECEISDYKVSLSLCLCDGVKYDPEMLDTDELTIDSEYPLIEMNLDFIPIESFADRYNISLDDALLRLNSGKLYTAKIINGKWFVSELQELPPARFEFDHYSLKEEFDSKVLEEYPFLSGCCSFLAKRVQDDAIDIKLYKDFGDETITLKEENYDMLMFSLVKHGCIESNCISEVIDRKKTMTEKKWKAIKRGNKKSNENEPLQYGYVVVNNGRFRGRIGYYDDDEGYDECIVYFGDPILTNEYYTIKRRFVSNRITSKQLQKRSEEVFKLLFDSDGFSKYDYHLLLEYYLCREIKNERYIDAMYKHPNKNGYKVFISYARKDLPFAQCLATDLMEYGYNVFLSEITTDIGDNIIYEISSFLGEAIAFIALISEAYNKSIFCRDEWTAFYMKFAKSNPNSIYPIILDDSEPPALLSAIKYERYNNYNYDSIFNKLLKAIKKKLPLEK